MEHLFPFIIGALQITLLDLTLCADNIGVIALATKNLPSEYAKKAGMLGIAGAIGLRIFFASFMTLILAVQWLPIKLVGGLLLLKITWDFVRSSDEEEEAGVKVANKFWEAVGVIIIADVSMSLDNVLAIAGAANGSIALIIFGIALNVPILFLGSQYVADLMKKHPIVIYIGGAVLAHTAFKMILEDHLLEGYIPHALSLLFPWLMAILTLDYGYGVSARHIMEKEI